MLRYPLSTTVPMALLVVGLLAIAGIGAVVYRDARQGIIADERAYTLKLATLVSGQLAYYLRHDNVNDANQLLDSIKVDRSVVGSLVLDSKGRIIMSGANRLLNRPVGQTPYGQHRALIARGLGTMRPLSTVTKSDEVLAAVPLRLGIEGGELAPSRLGLLVLHRDIAVLVRQRLAIIHTLLASVSALLVLMLLGLWFGLHKLLLVRMQRLVGALSAQHSGALDLPANLRGTDELSAIARACRRYSQRLLDSVANEREALTDLIRSERRYRNLFMNSPDAIFVNRGGRIVMANAACVALFGAESEEQLLGRFFAEFCHPGDHPLSEERIHLLRDLGQAAGPVQETIVRLDGVVVDVEVSASAFAERDEVALHFILRDITERVEREREITLHRNFLQATLDSTADGIVACDEDGRLTTFNRTARRWHLADSESLTAEQWTRRYGLYEADASTPLAASDMPLARAYRGEVVHNVEMVIAPRGAPRRHVLASGAPVIDDEGNQLGAVISMQDITERKRAEAALKASYQELERRVEERTAQLAAANDRLRELDRLKSLFIASMSHELRTPLNAIIGFTGLLLMRTDGPLTEAQEDYLQRANASARLLSGLVSDIIDVSKIEAGKIDVQVEDVDIGKVVAEAVETVEGEATDKGLAICVSGDTHATARTDRRRVLQCVLNLVSNAVKYTPSGEITITMEQKDASVRIAVTDTGIGIAEEDLGRLFTQFSRIDSPETTGIPGTGLGLYLTRNLVERVLQGSVGVVSHPRQGSTFWLEIPRSLNP